MQLDDTTDAPVVLHATTRRLIDVAWRCTDGLSTNNIGLQIAGTVLADAFVQQKLMSFFVAAEFYFREDCGM